MRAIVIHSFGAPEVLNVEQLPTPIPRADEVLVKVNAASVNPVDYKTRRSAISLMPEKCGRISRPYSGLPRLVRRSANWKPSSACRPPFAQVFDQVPLALLFCPIWSILRVTACERVGF